MNAFDRLGQHIAREQDALRSRMSHRALVRERLANAELPTGSPRARRIWIGVASTAVAAAALLWLARPVVREPLTLAVGGSQKPTPVGAFIEAPKLQSLRLRFSDGTRIEMAPGSRARLVALEAQGAHLSLESGQARVRVVRRPHASWRLSVGPFLVRVTGTRFDLRWNPEQDHFELDLEEGHVEVSGCAFGQGYHMAAGQKVDASCERRRFDVTDRRLTEGSAASEARTPPASPSAAQPSRIEPRQAAPVAVMGAATEKQFALGKAGARATSRSDRALTWRAPAERGRYAAAFAAAKASGFEAACARANADDLALLADAARYAREPADEAYALHLLRHRFSGTRRAALAAFALGRLEFDDHRAYDEARAWFSTYLKEQAKGPLTREARGRLMEATLGAGDREGARELAVHYLRDYPTGPHAELARGLLTAAKP